MCGKYYQKTQEELFDALSEQREFLRTSCALYDEGKFSEAKRIATCIYTICHDGKGKTVSLLTQLGLRAELQFITSSDPLTKDETVPKIALAAVFGLPDRQADILPYCARPSTKNPPLREVSFLRWWGESVFQEVFTSQTPPYRRTFGRTLSRMNLVFSMRNQDGGSHVDDKFTSDEYVNFHINGLIGMYQVDENGNSIPFTHPHLATMRQMGWELEQTLIPVAGGPVLPPPATWPPKHLRLEGRTPSHPATLTIIPPKKKMEDIG